MDKFSMYLPMIKFIADFLGSKAEVVLCDVEKNQVLYVENPISSEKKIGQPIRNLEQRYIDQKLYQENNFIGNYRAFSMDKRKLRSSTYFIKDEEGNLIGLITINFIVEKHIELREMLDSIISGDAKIEDQPDKNKFYESFDLSFEEMMSTTISDALKKFDVSPDRLSVEERMELVRVLDKTGMFLLKGSITELARILSTTEKTVYRYINKLK